MKKPTDTIRGITIMLLECPDFLFLDVETTKISPKLGGRIFEIAVVPWLPDAPAWTCVLQSIKTPAATLTFEDIAPTLHTKIHNKTLVMHHTSFDLSFLHAEFSRARFSMPSISILDTLSFSKRLLPEHPRHTLDALASTLELKHRPTHQALKDALTTRDLFCALMHIAKRQNHHIPVAIPYSC